MATTPTIRTTMPTDAPRLETLQPDALLKLAAWLSPAFPIGAFAYSHGLEYAVEAGVVASAADLQDWGRHLLANGPVRQDAVLLARAYREAGDDPALRQTAEIAAALKGTPELAQETIVQGEAFWRTVAAAWPHPELDRAADCLNGVPVALPIAVGTAASAHRLPLAPVLVVYLHAFCANMVSAALRLSLIGQTDGQRVLAALEPDIADAAGRAEAADPDDLGAAAVVVDWCSMRHETQHTRLFRS